MLITSSLALLSACAALFFFQSVSLREGIVRDLFALAEIIATQSTAAVTFQDRQAADEILKALKVKEQIVSAQIQTKDGELVASYGHKTGQEQSKLRENGFALEGRYIFLRQPITLDSQEIGILYLQADYQTTYWDLLRFYGGVLTLVMLGSMLLITLLTTIFQRAITKPILKLAATAAMIAKNKDYSVRAEKFGEDEIGRLTEAFNMMLAQIQTQDAELKESRERFEVAVAGSRDGLWDWNFVTGKAYYSPHWKNHLGYEDHEIANDAEEWRKRVHPNDLAKAEVALQQHLQGEIPIYLSEHRMLHKDGTYRWVCDRGLALRDANGKAFRIAGTQTDITERKQAEQELENLNQRLVKISRQAGMAEVATGVLHNVGNVLNSVNVSATLVADKVRQQKIPHLIKAVALLNEHLGDATEFLNQDPKGKVLPNYLKDMANYLLSERQENLTELISLTKNVEHIKEIVAMQQSYAKVSGATGSFDLVDIVEDAIKINMAGFARHQVRLVRDFEPTFPVFVDRHKALQILINLLNNAKYALDEAIVPDKQITVHIRPKDSSSAQIIVRDNGIGIAPENLIKIFNLGFTTRKEGHGFGLHSGANTAKEMGGNLSVLSDGPGTGATFTLELPLTGETIPLRVAAN
jgi:PAS domain S-box-containing protein